VVAWKITQGVFAWRVLSGGPSEYSDNGLIYAVVDMAIHILKTRAQKQMTGPFPGIAGLSAVAWSDNRNPSGTSSDPSIEHFTIFLRKYADQYECWDGNTFRKFIFHHHCVLSINPQNAHRRNRKICNLIAVTIDA